MGVKFYYIFAIIFIFNLDIVCTLWYNICVKRKHIPEKEVANE